MSRFSCFALPADRPQRRRHRRRGQCHRLRRPGARPQHRRRLRRPARSGLRRLLRHRRLYLRHPVVLAGAAAVVGVLGAVPVAGPGRPHPRRRACPTSCISPCRSGSRMPICGVVAAFFGVLFGAPTLRLRGDYLAIVTLGFGEIVPIVARNTPYLTNGAIGLNGAAPPRLFGYSFGVASEPLLLSRPADDRASDLRQPAAAEFAGRARLDGDPRGRDRGRRHGHQPDPSEAAGLRDRRRFRRHDRRLLCRQAADGDARTCSCSRSRS